MKKIISILILLLIAVNGFSKCRSNGLRFWPSGNTVNEKSFFMIEGFATSQKIIEGLGATHKVYLKSGEHTIKLDVIETLVGQFRLTQAILRPEKSLSAGLEYELVIENLGDAESEASRYDDSTKQRGKVKWKVISKQDTVPPAWTRTPKFKNDTYAKLGCGPSAFAIFSYAATDSSEILIKTTVKNLSSGKEIVYYLKGEEGSIAVGHGMCSGAFKFTGSEKFEVEFSLFDASGNLTSWTDERIKFKKPS